jgi:hypothetical protein
VIDFTSAYTFLSIDSKWGGGGDERD